MLKTQAPCLFTFVLLDHRTEEVKGKHIIHYLLSLYTLVQKENLLQKAGGWTC